MADDLFPNVGYIDPAPGKTLAPAENKFHAGNGDDGKHYWLTPHQKGKTVVLVYPVDKWILMLLAAGAKVRNLGDIKWLATEDGSAGKSTGRHIACFVLEAERTP